MDTTMKKLLSALLILASAAAPAQDVFTKYGPVAGIQKSTGVTFQNTAAVALDISGLFCGSSSTTFLRADGTCAVPAGSGVSSITVPAPLTATGCTGGACSISWTGAQTANLFLATPNGTTGATALRAIVGADIPPTNLGSTANGGVASASILLGTNGGTSNGFFSVTGPTTTLRTFTFPNASATVLTTNAAVTVAQGGTGVATLTTHGVLLGEGTSNVSAVAAMAADTVLMGVASADPAAVAVNNCGSSTTALSYSTSTHTFGCQTISTGGTGTVTNVATGTGLTGGPITTTGTLSVDQTASLSWTGTETFNTNQTLFTNSATNWNPIALCATGQSSGSRCFAFRIGGGGDLQLTVANDAGSAGDTAIDVGRSGTAVTALVLGNSTDNTRITSSGPFISGGTAVTIANTAGGCGTPSSIVAGAQAGKFVANITGTCAVRLTFPGTGAPNGWTCSGDNLATGNALLQGAFTATTADFTIPTTSGNVVVFQCTGW